MTQSPVRGEIEGCQQKQLGLVHVKLRLSILVFRDVLKIQLALASPQAISCDESAAQK